MAFVQKFAVNRLANSETKKGDIECQLLCHLTIVGSMEQNATSIVN
jgi:hypothetical protein